MFLKIDKPAEKYKLGNLEDSSRLNEETAFNFTQVRIAS
jgi:hypothetical protein